MRLININNLEMKEYFGADIPAYAALSHVWDVEEVTFNDWQSGHYKHMIGWQKIRGTIVQARSHRTEYVWIDTCCIDKSSSAELSEAINSMFQWYRNARVCFVYLADVRTVAGFEHVVAESRWFTRGWTLQELIAPKHVQFFSADWTFLGDKLSRIIGLHSITRIDIDVLKDPSRLSCKSISSRMSWASQRKTTREEDIAYCLLGIFDVHMPLLYGEGSRAFMRLQHELSRSQNDHTLLAHACLAPEYGKGFPLGWCHTTKTSLYATHPSEFAGGAMLDHFGSTYGSRMSLSNEGLTAWLPVMRLDKRAITELGEYPADIDRPHAIAILGCGSSQYPDRFCGMLFVIDQDSSTTRNVLHGHRRHLGGGCGTLMIPVVDTMTAELTEVCIAESRHTGVVLPSIASVPHIVVCCTGPNRRDDEDWELLEFNLPRDRSGPLRLAELPKQALALPWRNCRRRLSEKKDSILGIQYCVPDLEIDSLICVLRIERSSCNKQIHIYSTDVQAGSAAADEHKLSLEPTIKDSIVASTDKCDILVNLRLNTSLPSAVYMLELKLVDKGHDHHQGDGLARFHASPRRIKAVTDVAKNFEDDGDARMDIGPTLTNAWTMSRGPSHLMIESSKDTSAG